MKNRKKAIISMLLVLVLAVLVFLGIYLLRPRSFEEVFPFSPSPETNFSMSADEGLTVDGLPVLVETEMHAFAGEEGYEAVMDVLKSTKYRPMLMNILPPAWQDTAGNGGVYVVFFLVDGDFSQYAIFMTRDNRSKISAGDGRYYRFTEPETLDRLVALCKQYGTLRE